MVSPARSSGFSARWESRSKRLISLPGAAGPRNYLTSVLARVPDTSRYTAATTPNSPAVKLTLELCDSNRSELSPRPRCTSVGTGRGRENVVVPNPEAQEHSTATADSGGDRHPESSRETNGPRDDTGKLDRELLRSQDQLRLAFELLDQLSNADDPDAIQATLLERYTTLLRADAVFLDRAGCCMRVPTGEPGEARPQWTPDQLRGALARSVELARRRHQTLTPALTADEAAQLNGAHVLLGTLPRGDGETAVVVALRDRGAPPFDQGDTLASASILSLGAQVLHQVLAMRHLQRTALETVCTLVNAIDAKDNYTSAHSERVGGFARLTGEALGLSKEQIRTLEWAGLLHDVGKIGIAEHILNKPGSLTDAEFEEMKRHSQLGYEVLRPVAQFQPMLDAVLCHHENHDGTGYPAGLAGDEIPVDARIIHVVDIFDALTTERPYRRAYDIDLALKVLEAGAGRTTDPAITRTFIEALRRYMTENPADFRSRFGHLREAGLAAAGVN